jgi:hypothetical protein
MQNPENAAGDYFKAAEMFGGLSGLGSIQFSEEDPLEPTRRLMPAFMEAKFKHRTKVGHPLTVINKKAYADPISPDEFWKSKIIEQVIDIQWRGFKPTKEKPEPQKRTWGLIRTEGDRAKWVEVIDAKTGENPQGTPATSGSKV